MAAASPTTTPVSEPAAILAWIRANPLLAGLWVALAVTIGVFYAGVPLFSRHTVTTLGWARAAWNPETHYEHGPLVPFIGLGLAWHALPRLRTLRAEPDNLGLVPLLFGVLLFILAARTLQPRVALAALPLLLLGGALYAGGRQIARVLLFPIICLFFMIPVPGIDQATVKLQLFAAKAAQTLCGFIGLKLAAVGTSLHAVDESFSFEIAEGCSGINSLMAITLMTAIFAHLTQDRWWKKLLLFAGSVPVAIIGNVARLVSIMIVAKVFGQTIAGGWFHDISPYLISFPFAFGSLCLLQKLLNLRIGGKLEARAVAASPVISVPRPPPPSTYDY